MDSLNLSGEFMTKLVSQVLEGLIKKKLDLGTDVTLKNISIKSYEAVTEIQVDGKIVIPTKSIEKLIKQQIFGRESK